MVNISSLEKKFEDGETVDIVSLYDRAIIRRKNLPVKILGDGGLTKKLELRVDAVSSSAKEKIEKVGGRIMLL